MRQNTEGSASEVQDFSLMQNGMLYKLFVRLRLCGPGLEYPERKIMVLIGITWLPLFILSLMHASIPDLRVPFLYKIEVHIRFLIALPIFVFAEVVANKRIRILLKQFYLRKIIANDEVPLLNHAGQKATKLANSKIADVVMLILVATLGNWFWGEGFSLDTVNTWYAVVVNGEKH